MIDAKVTISLSNADYKRFKSIAFDKDYKVLRIGRHGLYAIKEYWQPKEQLQRLSNKGLVRVGDYGQWFLTEAGKYLWAKG